MRAGGAHRIDSATLLSGAGREFVAAWRQLRRHPWFVAGASLSLALGMALATAVFSVMEAVRDDAFPWDTNGRVVRITETHWDNDAGRVSPAFLQLLAGGVTTLADVAAHRSGPAIIGRTGAAQRVHAARRRTSTIRIEPRCGCAFPMKSWP